MADFTSWEDVRRYLDDPNVSDDEKRRILRTYANGNATPAFLEYNEDYWEHRDEILAYAERYGVEDHVEDQEEFKSEEDIERGQRQLADATARADADIARAQARADLEAAAGRTAAQGGSGMATSDELLEPGSRGLYFFELFLPPYRDWTGAALDLDADFREPYDELKEIAFAKFRADAAAMNDVHTELLEITLDINSQTDVLQTFWTGPAADAANEYCRVFQADARSVADNPETVATLIIEGIDHIESAVLARAETVLGLAADRVGGVVPGQITRLITVARREANFDRLKNMIVSGWSMFSGIDPDWFDFPIWIEVQDLVRDTMASQAQSWLDGTFVAEFEDKKKLFDDTCRATKKSVKEGWEGIVEGVSAIDDNPFANLDGGIQLELAPTIPPAAPAAATAPVATSTSGTAAEEAPPPVPPVGDLGNADTQASGDGAGVGSSSGGGSSSGAGGSSGGGAGGSSAPMPPAPVLGDIARPPGPLNPLPTPDLAKPDSVTVSDGTISYLLTEPDENGHATLTVDTGDGTPTTHELDFDAAGDDGAVTIQDGDLMITVQRPVGPGEPIAFTVDNGTGEPTTYSVDFDSLPDEPSPITPMWRADLSTTARVSDVLNPTAS